MYYLQNYHSYPSRIVRYKKSWVTPIGFDLINALFPTRGQSLIACTNSRITTVIQVGVYDLRNHGPLAASLCKSLYFDMHDLIFDMTTDRINQCKHTAGARRASVFFQICYTTTTISKGLPVAVTNLHVKPSTNSLSSDRRIAVCLPITRQSDRKQTDTLFQMLPGFSLRDRDFQDN